MTNFTQVQGPQQAYIPHSAPMAQYGPPPFVPAYAQQMPTASPVDGAVVQTVAVVHPLVDKYRLSSVQIDSDDRVRLKEANDFVAFFKKRLIQFLIRHGALKEEIEAAHAIAGGFLSDSYMRTQYQLKQHTQKIRPNENAFAARDLDAFLQIPVDLFVGLDMELFVTELKIELLKSTRYHATVEIANYERSYTYEFLSVPYIFSIKIPGMLPMEIITCNNLERIMDFDISIRHFFNFEDDLVYAADFAIKSVQERRLTLVCPITPKSSLVRLFYMKRRYSFSIDRSSLSLLAWSMGKKDTHATELITYAMNVEKFSHDFLLKDYILTHVYAFLEEYSVANEGTVLRKDIPSNFLSAHLTTVAGTETGYYQPVKDLELSYAGTLEANFPFGELFEPIFKFVNSHSFYDVLFANDFPHGFFGRFFTFIQGNKDSYSFLMEHGDVYLDVLKTINKRISWPNLYITYEEADEKKNQMSKQKEERKAEIELLKLFNSNPEIIGKFISKSTRRKFRKGEYASHGVDIDLPEESLPEDIPAFLIEKSQSGAMAYNSGPSYRAYPTHRDINADCHLPF